MEKSGSYVNQIVSEVKKMIINQELKVGDRLPTELELSKKFGKSRGCVREAIKILESYGILEVKQGDGTYVCASVGAGMFDALFFQIIAKGSDFEELKKLRNILEVGIVKSAIHEVQPSDIESVIMVEEELRHVIEENKDIDLLVDLDLKFHRTIAAITRNGVLQEVYKNLLEIFRPYILKSYERQNHENHFSVSFYHELFIQALQERDTELGYIAVKRSMNDWSRLQ